jgi:AcrR family transcriptional regulator
MIKRADESAVICWGQSVLDGRFRRIRMYTFWMLSHQQVVEAGLEVVHAADWAALSLRGVASHLGVTPMALYRYVSDGHTLQRDVLTAIVAEMVHVVDSGDPWTAFDSWARAAHTQLVKFPGTAGHLLTVWFEMPSILVMTDGLLGVAKRAGFSGSHAVAAVNALFVYVLMRAQTQNVVQGAGVTKRTLATAKVGHELAHLKPLISHYATAEFDTHFEYGLRALILGIQAMNVTP